MALVFLDAFDYLGVELIEVIRNQSWYIDRHLLEHPRRRLPHMNRIILYQIQQIRQRRLQHSLKIRRISILQQRPQTQEPRIFVSPLRLPLDIIRHRLQHHLRYLIPHQLTHLLQAQTRRLRAIIRMRVKIIICLRLDAVHALQHILSQLLTGLINDAQAVFLERLQLDLLVTDGVPYLDGSCFDLLLVMNDRLESLIRKLLKEGSELLVVQLDDGGDAEHGGLSDLAAVLVFCETNDLVEYDSALAILEYRLCESNGVADGVDVDLNDILVGGTFHGGDEGGEDDLDLLLIEVSVTDLFADEADGLEGGHLHVFVLVRGLAGEVLDDLPLLPGDFYEGNGGYALGGEAAGGLHCRWFL